MAEGVSVLASAMGSGGKNMIREITATDASYVFAYFS